VVHAQGIDSPDSWTGGNGWCDEEAGICFRAWVTGSRIELRWLVEVEPAPTLRVSRTPVSGTSRDRQIIAESYKSGEFVFIDDDVQPGIIYIYELEQVDPPKLLGEPVEAGVSVSSANPDVPCLVYLPVAFYR